MLYGRPGKKTIIPNSGILLYKMKLIQMDNECLERELKLAAHLGLNQAHREALQKEIKAREDELQLYQTRGNDH